MAVQNRFKAVFSKVHTLPEIHDCVTSQPNHVTVHLMLFQQNTSRRIVVLLLRCFSIAIKGLQFKDVVHACMYRKAAKRIACICSFFACLSFTIYAKIRSSQSKEPRIRNPIYGNQQTVYITVQVLPYLANSFRRQVLRY